MTTRRTSTRTSAANKGSGSDSTLELKIGIVNSSREIVIESDRSSDDIRAAVAAAIDEGSLIELPDVRGRRVLIAPDKLAYVDIGEPSSRRVGFGG